VFGENNIIVHVYNKTSFFSRYNAIIVNVVMV